jgi:SAM-dependent methyltransferase
MEGAINVDMVPLPGVDVVCDIGGIAPFRDDRFSVVMCKDVLEHVDLEPTVRELYRILAPGGALVARVPHFTSRNVWVDPTHRRGFSARTFDFFCADDGPGSYGFRNYYFQFRFSRREVSWVEFRKTWSQPWNKALERSVNRSLRGTDWWEHTGFCRLFPGHNVVVVLRK